MFVRSRLVNFLKIYLQKSIPLSRQNHFRSSQLIANKIDMFFIKRSSLSIRCVMMFADVCKVVAVIHYIIREKDLLAAKLTAGFIQH